jgi:hypothetical protein
MTSSQYLHIAGELLLLLLHLNLSSQTKYTSSSTLAYLLQSDHCILIEMMMSQKYVQQHLL